MNAITNLTAAPACAAGRFSVEAHPVHSRLRHVAIAADVVRAFLEQVADIDIQALEYIPFMRFIVAAKLAACAGEGFAETLVGCLNDRRTGGFTLGVEGVTRDPDDFVKFGAAVGHLIGPSNHDLMSGKFYARFLVKDTDASDSYLRQAYRLFTLHTDGTFVDEATDWLLMMKFSEENAVGGESRLMHLDDWSERDRFLEHPLGTIPFVYKAPASKNVAMTVERPVFFQSQYGLSLSFIDQFVQPRSGVEARYLHDLSLSMETSAGTKEIPLPVGDLIVLNNYFWLHGRAPFQKNLALDRELMRLRGMFAA
jgi:glutarate dioxygenase